MARGRTARIGGAVVILAFTDCETTHLSAEIGEVWEVAVILRDHSGAESEHLWQFRPVELGAADPDSLEIGRFEERFAVPDGCGAAYTAGGDIDPMGRADAITEITEMLRGATLVGSNPGFDDRHLRELVGPGGAQWAYRPLCVATLAEGHLWALNHDLMAQRQADDPNPPSSRWLAKQVGVEPPTIDVAHTALGDARWCKAVYDAITGGAR
jgi:hypothetical protein